MSSFVGASVLGSVLAAGSWEGLVFACALEAHGLLSAKSSQTPWALAVSQVYRDRALLRQSVVSKMLGCGGFL